MAKTRVSELKHDLQKKRRDELRASHVNQKLEVEKTHLEEFNHFNDFWDKKMIEFDSEAKRVEDELMERHVEEYRKVNEELE